MKFSLAILFLFLLVLTPMVVAQPPSFQTIVIVDTGIQLEVPIISEHQFNKNFGFKVHAHNATDGTLLADNTTMFCILHLYRHSDGKQIIELNMTLAPTNRIDFELEILAGNFTELGQYSVLFYCEDSGGGNPIGGFLEHPFDVTADGKDGQTFPTQFVIIILGLAFIIIGALEERLKLFQIIGSMVIIIMGILTLYPGYSFINWTTLFGKTLGFGLIGLGCYFLIEHSFSRDEQAPYFEQPGEDEELFDFGGGEHEE